MVKSKLIKLIYDLNWALDASFNKHDHNIKEASELLKEEIKNLLIEKARLEKENESFKKKNASLEREIGMLAKTVSDLLEYDDVCIIFKGDRYDIIRTELVTDKDPLQVEESLLTVYCRKNEILSRLISEAKEKLGNTETDEDVNDENTKQDT